MSRTPTVSLVIVSRGRAESLKRTLAGVARMAAPGFETVLVADRAGREAAAPFRAGMIVVPFDRPGISEARNCGIAAASGEIVAFLDDDAVPETTWLARLTAPFCDPRLAAATGWVRGRNGISWQSRSEVILPTGETVAAGAVPGAAVKLIGTNMAVRREVLAALGGFDPAYRFYLDDSDLSIRLAEGGYQAAHVPEAEVHHASAPSVRRGRAREPLELTEIGESLGAFLARHCPEAARTGAAARARTAEVARLDRHLLSGGIEPRDLGRRLAEFDRGLAEGLLSDAPALQKIGPPGRFRPGVTRVPRHRTLIARPGRFRSGLDRARALAEAGEAVTFLAFVPGPARHRVRFLAPGVWIHRGGISGASDREQPFLTRWGRAARARAEMRRVARARRAGAVALAGVGPILGSEPQIEDAGGRSRTRADEKTPERTS